MQRLGRVAFADRRYEGLRLVEAFIDDVRAGREEPERVGEVLSPARWAIDGLEVFFGSRRAAATPMRPGG